MTIYIYRFVLVASLLLISVLLIHAQPDKFFRSQPYIQYLTSQPPPPAQRTAPMKHLFTTDTHLDSAAFSLYAADFEGVLVGDAIWIDYDNDGDLDVMVSGWNDFVLITKIYRNDDGTFTDIHADLPQTATEHGVAWGDYDNDGDFDFVITGGLDSTGLHPISKIFRNDNGTFVDINAPLMPLLGGVATWVDYNLDGKLDLLIAGSPNAGGSFYTKLYRNDDSTFTETGFYFPGVWGASVDWGDYDNDGDPDLLLTGYGDWGVTVGLFRNDGSTFTFVPSPFQAINSSSVSWVDYDNDGYLDVLLAGDPPGWENNTFVAIYRNRGDGTFENVPTNLPPTLLSAVAWGDYDNDGDPDIAISGWSSDDLNITMIFRNDGGGVFTDINANLPGTFWGSLAWGDVDNDGRLDLLMTGGTRPTPFSLFYHVGVSIGQVHPITAIYHNNTSSPDGRPSAPPNIATTVSNRSVEFNWNRATDDHTPQHMLTYNLRVGTQPGSNDVVAPSSNITTGYRRLPKTGNASKMVSRTLNNLPDGMYYWSVQAIDNSFAGSTFAPTETFVIGRVAPPTPAGITGLSTSPTLLWGAITGAQRYYLQVATDEAFTALVVDDPTITNLSRAIGPLVSGQTYYWRVSATSDQVWSDWSSVSTFIANAGDALYTLPLSANWKLISLPAQVSNSSVGALFPGSANVFAYQGAYQPAASLASGTGYWLRYSDAPYVTVSGTPITSLNIPVSDGWNLIGSLGSSLDVAAVQSSPSGIVVSNFFGYAGTYYPAATLQPFQGYWVKANGAGTIDLSSSTNSSTSIRTPASSLEKLHPLQITDARGRTGKLYYGVLHEQVSTESFELPPLPPEGILDARFASQRIAECIGKDELKLSRVQLSSAEYPVIISWSAASDILALLIVGGTKHPLSTDGSVKISDSETAISLRLQGTKGVPEQFLLHQNYPNPFNPQTSIAFDLLHSARVTLKVHNTLGQEVATLVRNESMDRGMHEVEFDAAALPSALYFYTLTATTLDGKALLYSDTKKMLLVK